jgi:RNA polymerase sigma factor for flagellar operon FliA
MNTEELWANHTPGDVKSRNLIIEHYSGLVKKVALKISRKLPKSVSIDDLIGYGNFGLIGAIDRFEPDRGFKFETYAARRVHGAILDGLRDADWVPRSVRSKAKDIERASQLLENDLGRHPTPAEIAEHLDLDESQVLATLSDVDSGHMETIESYNDPSEIENSASYSMALATPGDASQNLELESIIESLTEAMASIEERERIVLHLVYWEDMSMADIGIVLGVTESRVCQILTKANAGVKDRLDLQVS